MAFTPITGAISFADINTALGRSSTTSFSLGDTLVRQLTNQLSGAIDLNNAHASDYISATTTNVNLLTRFGSPATVTSYKALIPSGVTVGATSGNTALTVGQFPTGSTIAINNYGDIQAYGGAASSAGGDAINANYANQTVTINNQTGATIYGGGGGGGTGGNGGSGGTGGTGGGGSYVNSGVTYEYQSNVTYWSNGSYLPCCGAYRERQGWWHGSRFYFNGGNTGGLTTGEYIAGYYVGSYAGYYVGCGLFYVGQPYSNTVYTSGGAGGAGGAGGSTGGGGGLGQGYGQTSTAGSAGGAGSGGSAGSAGGTNAGAGGTGGSGGARGTGGSGGTWGTAGTAGNTGVSGSTGTTGASGNNGGGSAGSAGGTGSAGASGGTAGRYLVKGANSVTLINSGTVLGGLA